MGASPRTKYQRLQLGYVTSSLNTEHIETAARALLDDRVSAVRTLVKTRQSLADHKAKVDTAERAAAAAYAAAQRAGWTPDELKKLGLDSPHRKTPGRPRRIRQPEPSDTGFSSTPAFARTAAPAAFDHSDQDDAINGAGRNMG